MEIDACDPIVLAMKEVNAKQHVTLFLIPNPIAKIEPNKIPYPNDCCIVATSRSFLITGFIFTFLKMNPKHIIDDTIPKIAPNIKAIFDFVGPERSTDIFELRVIFILEKDLCLDTRGDVSLSKLRESKFFLCILVLS